MSELNGTPHRQDAPVCEVCGCRSARCWTNGVGFHCAYKTEYTRHGSLPGWTWVGIRGECAVYIRSGTWRDTCMPSWWRREILQARPLPSRGASIRDLEQRIEDLEQVVADLLNRGRVGQ